jgi:PAS domain S-box-containing protein
MLTAASGAAALALWINGSWQLLTIGPDDIPMAPITATLFFLLGLSILARRLRPDSDVVRRVETMGVLLAIGIAVVEIFTPWLGVAAPWRGLLTPFEAPAFAFAAGRMSPLTAASFLLVGLAILSARRHDPRSRWVAVLCAVATLLIALIVLAGYAAGAPFDYGPGRVPMALLTAATLAFLGLSQLLDESTLGLVRDRLGIDPDTPELGGERTFALRLGGLTLGLALLIVATAIVYTRNELTQARASVWRELDSVASLKARELEQWREERLAEGRFLWRTPQIADDIRGFLAAPNSRSARQRVVNWLEPIRGGDRYESAQVFDAQGRLRLSIPEGAPLEATSLAPAQAGAGVTLGPLTLDPAGRLHLDVRVPIGGPAPLGTILLRVDPRRHLYPLLVRWPVPSRTAEVILARREGNEVVFLHDVRHRPDAALKLRLPVDSAFLPTARAARGEMGTREGIDYRFEPVISSARAIPGSRWILVAKVDQAEVYAPIRADAARAVLSVVTLLLTVGLAAAYLLRERHALALQRGLSAERDRGNLAERLALVTQHANDIILVLSEDGRILEANERASAAYGYTIAELLSMNTADFRVDGDHAAAAERLRGMADHQGVRFESRHRRKDGSTFDVEISGRAVMSEGRRVIMAIHRDVSERKAHEVQIERLNRLYAALSHVNQAIVRATTSEGLLNDVCRALVEAGRFRMAWVGEVETSTNEVRSIAGHGDTAGYLAGLRITINDEPAGRGPTGAAIREKCTQVCDDVLTDPRMGQWREAAIRAGYRSSIGLPLTFTGGRRGVLAVYAEEPGFFKQEEIALLEEAAVDTAFGLANLDKDEQRRQAEESLRNVSIAVEQSPVSIVITDLVGNIVYVNPHFCRLTGYSREEVIGQNPRLLQSGEIPPAVYAEMWRRLTAGEVWEGEFHNRKKDGELFWEHATISPVRDARGEIKSYVGVKEDITERRRAAEQMAAQLAELLRWQAAMLGREGRLQELKREVNELSRRQGHPPPYPSQDSAPPGTPPPKPGAATG